MTNEKIGKFENKLIINTVRWCDHFLRINEERILKMLNM